MKPWSMDKQKKAFALLCAVILLVSTLPLYWIAFDNHPYYDDYGLSAEVRRAWVETGSVSQMLSAAVENERNTRQSWQGTYTSTFLSSLHPGVFSEDLYWVATFVLLTLFVGCFGCLLMTAFGRLGMDRWSRLSLTCLALTLMIQFMPDVGEAFFWYNGGIAYLGDYSLMALAAALVIVLLTGKSRGVAQTAALAVLAVMIGGGTYGGGLFSLCLSAVLLVWLFWKKHSKRWQFAGLVLLYALCFVYNMTAPGNGVRASYINYHASPVKAVVQSMYYGMGQMGGYITLPLLAVTLVMLPAMQEAAKKSPWSFAHPWLAFGLGVCLYCTQFTPPLYSIASIGAGRIINTYFVSFVVLWFVYIYYLLGFLARRGMELPQLTNRQMCALLLTSVCMLGIGCLGFKRAGDTLYGVQNMSGPSAMLSILTGEADRYDREMEEREVLLNDESLKEITLSPLSAVPPVFMDDLLVPGAVYDVRPSLCSYYGKEAIRIAGEEDAQ